MFRLLHRLHRLHWLNRIAYPTIVAETACVGIDEWWSGEETFSRIEEVISSGIDEVWSGEETSDEGSSCEAISSGTCVICVAWV